MWASILTTVPASAVRLAQHAGLQKQLSRPAERHKRSVKETVSQVRDGYVGVRAEANVLTGSGAHDL